MSSQDKVELAEPAPPVPRDELVPPAAIDAKGCVFAHPTPSRTLVDGRSVHRMTVAGPTDSPGVASDRSVGGPGPLAGPPHDARPPYGTTFTVACAVVVPTVRFDVMRAVRM